jgi:hypothetical protein
MYDDGFLNLFNDTSSAVYIYDAKWLLMIKHKVVMAFRYSFCAL